MRIILTIIILSFLISEANAQSGDIKSLPDTNNVIRVAPAFPGGMKGLVRFMYKNLKPTGDLGKVHISFVVENDGSLTDFKIVKGLTPRADSSALSMMRRSPKWIPGTQDGKPVRVLYTIPLNFSDEF